MMIVAAQLAAAAAAMPLLESIAPSGLRAVRSGIRAACGRDAVGTRGVARDRAICR